jgi:hypothetical protein
VIIDAVATDQKIEVAEADVNAMIEKQSGDSAKSSADYKAQVKSILRKDKVFEYLLSVK